MAKLNFPPNPIPPAAGVRFLTIQVQKMQSHALGPRGYPGVARTVATCVCPRAGMSWWSSIFATIPLLGES